MKSCILCIFIHYYLNVIVFFSMCFLKLSRSFSLVNLRFSNLLICIVLHYIGINSLSRKLSLNLPPFPCSSNVTKYPFGWRYISFPSRKNVRAFLYRTCLSCVYFTFQNIGFSPFRMLAPAFECTPKLVVFAWFFRGLFSPVLVRHWLSVTKMVWVRAKRSDLLF